MKKHHPADPQWSPQTYDQFKDERLLPLLDLIKNIPDIIPSKGENLKIADLGAGTGAALEPLLCRWPEAELTLVEQDAAMLKRLKSKNLPLNVTLDERDIAVWMPDKPLDLIFSNAALHWLDHHDILIPALMSHLKPGGYLALGMPNNWQQPSHILMRVIAEDPRWEKKLRGLIREEPVLSLADYEALLKPLSQSVSVFETIYNHRLYGAGAVANWFKGSSLQPLMAALESEERAAFFQRYAEATDQAYKLDGAEGADRAESTDGSMTMPFHRLFIFAQKAG